MSICETRLSPSGFPDNNGTNPENQPRTHSKTPHPAPTSSPPVRPKPATPFPADRFKHIFNSQQELPTAQPSVSIKKPIAQKRLEATPERTHYLSQSMNLNTECQVIRGIYDKNIAIDMARQQGLTGNLECTVINEVGIYVTVTTPH